MSLLQEVAYLMQQNGADETSMAMLADRSQEELNMIKCAYEPKTLKAKYPEPIKKIGAGHNIPHKS